MHNLPYCGDGFIHKAGDEEEHFILNILNVCLGKEMSFSVYHHSEFQKFLTHSDSNAVTLAVLVIWSMIVRVCSV